MPRVALLAALTACAAAAPREWALFSLAAYPDALCLDGSPGGYYVLPGVPGAGGDTFVIHLQGGGWCSSLDDCRARAFDGPVYANQPSLGSSKAWGPGPCTPALANSTAPCVADGGSGGLLSSNATINPSLWAATKVYVGYCSGDSFSGSVGPPVPVNATASVYFRGAAIHAAVLADLAARHGLGAASAVLLKGCSAGGVAVYLRADATAAALRALAPGASFAALPGAGLFLDEPSFAGGPARGANIVAPLFQWVYETTNMTATTTPACRAKFGWRCIFPATLLPFIESRLFVANSLADAASQSFIMSLGCDPAAGACSPAALAYLDGFRAAMIAAAAPALAGGSRHGAFLLTCSVHMVENVDGAVAAIPVAGYGAPWSAQSFTLAQVFDSWFAGAAGAPVAAVDAAWTAGGGPHGGNAACARYGPVPSRP